MKYFDWNPEKNEWLRQERGISFEEIIFYLLHEGLLDIISHPNQKKYPGQRIFIIDVEDYVYVVPFIETDSCIFLKTIIPNSKMTKKYLRGDSHETE